MSSQKVLADATGKFINIDESFEESGSTSETEIMDEETELIIRDGVQNWLAIHGPKLFALEASKYLATEAKKKNLRSNR